MLWSSDFYLKTLTETRLWSCKIISKAAYRTRKFSKFTRIFPASNEVWTGEKFDQWQRGKPVQNCVAASGPILRICKYFHRCKKNLDIYFCLPPGILKCKNQRRMDIKYLLIQFFIGLQKNPSSDAISILLGIAFLARGLRSIQPKI